MANPHRLTPCCKNKLKHKADRLRKLIGRDEKRITRRKAELRLLAFEINRGNGLPPFCSTCDEGD
jgi:hypothetical protein